MYEFKLPDLGEGVHEGEILLWHVKPGDEIAEDAPLVEVETDKAAVTIPAPRAGRIVATHGEVGQTVAVGTVLVEIEEHAGAGAPGVGAPDRGSAPAAGAPAVGAADRGSAAVPATAAAAPAAPSRGPVPAAPATRRLARELGVELAQVPASGPGGRVTAEDVKRFAEGAAPAADAAAADPRAASLPAGAPDADADAAAAAAAAAVPSGIPFFKLEPLPDYAAQGPVTREPLRSIRRKVAVRMVTAAVVVPHVVQMDEADVTELDAIRREERARRTDGPGARLTLLPFVIKAATALLKAHPKLNASIDPFGQEIVYKQFYNVGFAADTERGLVVPVIRDADRKSVLALAAELADKAARARQGTLEAAELRGGTFTITNLGSLGGTGLIPTINYPEVAILALGRAAERPVVRDGMIVVRKLLPLTLAFDHRLIDGADGARFVSALVRLLAEPRRLLLEA